MTQVPVDRDALARLLDRAWDMFQILAEDAGYEHADLEAGSEIVTLACQAGLPLPGPLAPGHVPPAPPPWLGRLTAPTYRDAGDGRLRCTGCGKVVFGNQGTAGKAAAAISGDRQPMRTYIGPCGHWHLSRIKDRR
jgi:hypothetical protein